MKPKSANLYTASSSTYSGLSIFLAFQSPLYSGLSFIGASHSPSSSSSQSSGFFASLSTIRFSSTQSSGFFVLGIVNHGFISPIVRLLVSRVGDLFWLQHLPIFFDRP